MEISEEKVENEMKAAFAEFGAELFSRYAEIQRRAAKRYRAVAMSTRPLRRDMAAEGAGKYGARVGKS